MLKFVKIIMLIIGSWILSEPAIGQTTDTASFFPYQTGDFWVNEVYEMGAYIKDERVDVIADSLNSEGEKIYTVSSTLSFPNERIYHIKIDSSGNIYSDWWYDRQR